ncbi:MAG: CPBP family intramembrane metalloprotease [Spirochaetaceae bacterium]|nr:CPBP family intramembrane metalloprotease [Spirochaetaceae bacterium]MCF7938911.1 CPBP family intramembrane metalloprotease [Spirochaetales bacterium]
MSEGESTPRACTAWSNYTARSRCTTRSGLPASPLKRWFETHLVTSFFILTFLVSWGFWLPMVLMGKESSLLRIAGTYGPLLSALVVSFGSGGYKELRRLLRPFRIWRVSPGWYFFCFFSTALVIFAAMKIYLAAGGHPLAFKDPQRIYLALPVFLYILLFSVLGEETGWRGFALPRLQERMGPLPASLVIGLIWGLWHIPLFLIPENFHQHIHPVLFILQDVALAVVITWLYNGTGGSLLLVHLFHAASNTSLGVLPVLPMDTGGDPRPLYITFGLLALLAAGIILSWTLSPSGGIKSKR